MKSMTPISVNFDALPTTTTSTSSVAPNDSTFVTFKGCSKIRPFTEPALRDLKFKAFDRTNSRGEVISGNGTGPAGVWVQIGAKVLIDLNRFDKWVKSHRLMAGMPCHYKTKVTTGIGTRMGRITGQRKVGG